MTDPTGTTAYGYDLLDRLVEVIRPGDVTLGYGYDALSNRTVITYPTGVTVSYEYDVASRMITVTDWLARSTEYDYDAAGRLVAQANPNRTTTTYEYDNAGNTLSITHTSPVDGVFAFFRYTLDNVGNRLAMEDVGGTTSYAYDELYRLTGVTYPNGETVTYTYDAMGNRLTTVSSSTGATSYAYDAADRLLAAGPLVFTWDYDGNMLTKGDTAFTYDALNRLTELVTGTTSVEFTYDGDGTRWAKTVDGVATHYVQDVGAGLPYVLAETTGGSTTRYIYGTDMLASDDGSGWTGYHPDALGSTRDLTDGTGQPVVRYIYDAFGAVREMEGTSGNEFTFAGEQVDDETGLQFLRARYNDLETGRFVNLDPFSGRAIEPRSLNRYVYAANNPVIYRDQSGLDYIYAKVSGAGFKGLGAASELGVYQDTETFETRLVLRVGGGGGVGVKGSIESGSSTGELPAGGKWNIFMSASAAMLLDYGVSGRMNLDPRSGSSALNLSKGPLKVGISSSGAVLGGATAGVGAALYGGIDYSIILKSWRGGEVPGWATRLLESVGFEAGGGRFRGHGASSSWGDPPGSAK